MKAVTFGAGRGNELGLVQKGCMLFISRAAPEPVRDVPPAVALLQAIVRSHFVDGHVRARRKRPRRIEN
jgi:hypothetical protein